MKEIRAHRSLKQYAEWYVREIPDRIDYVRAKALIQLLNGEQLEYIIILEEIITCYEHHKPMQLLKIPHRCINLISTVAGVRWDGRAFTRHH